MSDNPKAVKVTVAVDLADGSTRTITAEEPETVTLQAWREPVDLLLADPGDMGSAGASIMINGGAISTGYVPAGPGQ